MIHIFKNAEGWKNKASNT